MPIVYVYILKSEKNGRYYIGSTNDYQRRLNEHLEGRSRYTRNSGPYFSVFCQEFPDIKTARKIEHKLKKLANRRIIEKIVAEQKITMGS